MRYIGTDLKELPITIRTVRLVTGPITVVTPPEEAIRALFDSEVARIMQTPTRFVTINEAAMKRRPLEEVPGDELVPSKRGNHDEAAELTPEEWQALADLLNESEQPVETRG